MRFVISEHIMNWYWIFS
uniref:Uncharacterized protein n=1 Tax=Arundo donax TaxID=35708 RepID=A0A0A9FFA3_ARUDO